MHTHTGIKSLKHIVVCAHNETAVTFCNAWSGRGGQANTARMLTYIAITFVSLYASIDARKTTFERSGMIVND